MIIYLGPRLLEGTSDLPGSLGRAVLTLPTMSEGRFPMWPCSRRGLPSTRHRCRIWWALTSPFHPYPFRGGLLFCGTVHGVAPCPVSGPPCPAELGLSSPRKPESDHLTRSESENRSQKSENRSQKKA